MRLAAAAVTLAAAALIALTGASATDSLIEDWNGRRPGARGIPPGWRAYPTPGGHPAYDLTIADEDGRRALAVRSHDDHSTIAKEVTVDLAATPILEWSWKITRLPAGADLRRAATSDATVHVLVVWPRFPAMLRSRVIAYAWGTAEPAPSVERSPKAGSVTFFILRSGAGDLGRWFTERRDIAEDYRTVYGEGPENPRAIAISIDTNDTRAPAAGFIGSISLRAR